MKTKDSSGGRRHRSSIRLTIEYVPGSATRADLANTVLTCLLEKAIIKRRKEQRDGQSGSVPNPVNGGSRDLEGNTKKDK